MIVRIIFRDPSGAKYELAPSVSYSWNNSRVPIEGEQIESDGSDEAMPEQIYYVQKVSWMVANRGCRYAVVEVYPQDVNAWSES